MEESIEQEVQRHRQQLIRVVRKLERKTVKLIIHTLNLLVSESRPRQSSRLPAGYRWRRHLGPTQGQPLLCGGDLFSLYTECLRTYTGCIKQDGEYQIINHWPHEGHRVSGTVYTVDWCERAGGQDISRRVSGASIRVETMFGLLHNRILTLMVCMGAQCLLPYSRCLP